ncbi:MAG: hypothetical protein ACOYNL_08360 [Rickettsiales bacterium]
MNRFFLSVLTMVAIATPTFAQQQSKVLLANPPVADLGPPPAIERSEIQSQLKRIGGGQNSKEALGQMMAVGTIMSCTQKTAGAEQTLAFYTEMQKVGKLAETYCRAKQPANARTLMLNTFAAKNGDPVVQSALGCYTAQQQNIQILSGPKIAADVQKYARWFQNPEAAQTEMRETDICKNSKG